jgi:hypothetical protein
VACKPVKEKAGGEDVRKLANPLRKSLNQLKDFLHEILESPIDYKLNARLGQQLRVDDKVLDRNGPIMIIQNQEVKPVVMINISKALRMIDTMDDQIEGSSIKYSMVDLLDKMMVDGCTWEQLRRRIKSNYFGLAWKKSGKDKKLAARMLGVGRSTLETHLNQHKYKMIDDKGGRNDGSKRDNGENL